MQIAEQSTDIHPLGFWSERRLWREETHRIEREPDSAPTT